MKAFLFLSLASIISAVTLAACTGTSAGPVTPPGPPKTMKAFASEQELTNYLKKLSEQQKLRRRVQFDNMQSAVAPAPSVAGLTTGALAKSEEPAQESVTNTQHAGVDEGDIVK